MADLIDCPRCPTKYVGNGCPMCERLPPSWLPVAAQVMPRDSFTCIVGDEERAQDRVRIVTQRGEYTATREFFTHLGAVRSMFERIAAEDTPQLVRLTASGDTISAPLGTTMCAQAIGQPHPCDLTHRLFAPDNPGPAVQLMTSCGRRAHRFIPESEGKDVDCPECLEEAEEG